MAFAASAFVRANSSAAALDIPGSKRSVAIGEGTDGVLPVRLLPILKHRVEVIE